MTKCAGHRSCMMPCKSSSGLVLTLAGLDLGDVLTHIINEGVARPASVHSEKGDIPSPICCHSLMLNLELIILCRSFMRVVEVVKKPSPTCKQTMAVTCFPSSNTNVT